MTSLNAAQDRRRARRDRGYLRSGSVVPTSTPTRYKRRDGYVYLHWVISPGKYATVAEHRVINGVVVDSETVHHINGDRSDNRPENLRQMSASEHMSIHNPVKWNVDAAHVLYMAGVPLSGVAKQFGVYSTTVLRAFKKRGLTMRSVMESLKLRPRPKPKAVCINGHSMANAGIRRSNLTQVCLICANERKAGLCPMCGKFQTCLRRHMTRRQTPCRKTL